VGVTAAQTAEAYMNGWTQVYGGFQLESESRGLPQTNYWVKLLSGSATQSTLYLVGWNELGGRVRRGVRQHAGHDLYRLVVCSLE